MAKKNTKITYDKTYDIISFWNGKASQVSIEVGDFIVDIDSNGFFVGLEVMNASQNLQIDSEILAKIEKAEMSILYKPKYVYIMIKIKIAGKEKDISIPLTLDLGHKKVSREQVLLSR